jgi:hypothetical protein
MTKAISKSIWWFTEGLGWSGLGCVGYTLISSYTTRWPAIELTANFLSTLLTLLGTLLTVLSIYLPTSKMRPPFRHSKTTVGPIVIAIVLTCLVELLVRRQLPMVLVSGIGLLGISGVLKRMLPYPQDPEALVEELARSANAGK